jgi:hypothetical protein
MLDGGRTQRTSALKVKTHALSKKSKPCTEKSFKKQQMFKVNPIMSYLMIQENLKFPHSTLNLHPLQLTSNIQINCRQGHIRQRKIKIYIM